AACRPISDTKISKPTSDRAIPRGALGHSSSAPEMPGFVDSYSDFGQRRSPPYRHFTAGTEAEAKLSIQPIQINLDQVSFNFLCTTFLFLGDVKENTVVFFQQFRNFFVCCMEEQAVVTVALEAALLSSFSTALAATSLQAPNISGKLPSQTGFHISSGSSAVLNEQAHSSTFSISNVQAPPHRIPMPSSPSHSLFNFTDSGQETRDGSEVGASLDSSREQHSFDSLEIDSITLEEDKNEAIFIRFFFVYFCIELNYWLVSLDSSNFPLGL
ncbi:unnamed protein product, partial [Protopolystoma xenopodis]